MEEGKRPRTYSGVLFSMCSGYEEALAGGTFQYQQPKQNETAQVNYQAYEEYKKLKYTNEYLTSCVQKIQEEKDQLQKELDSLEKRRPKIKRCKEKTTRHRRLARTIERHYRCTVCDKLYGSEGSLNQHIKIKHSQEIKVE